MKNTIERKLSFITVIVTLLIILTLSTMGFLDARTADQIHFYPTYDQIDLSTVIHKTIEADQIGASGSIGITALSPEDYKVLLYQTGLGKPGVDEILKSDAGSIELVLARLKTFQTNFFAPVEVVCRQIGIITYDETLTNEEDDPIQGFDIVDLKIGDVLISKSTHSTGWRHGHGAIVIDAKNKKVMEAALWGYNSQIQKTDRWRYYPTFMLMRLKSSSGTSGATSDEIAINAAKLAEKYMNDVPYGLLTGMFNKNPAPEQMNKTQCAYLVWYPYMQTGFDLDSDGGWLVTPYDIANSDLLEVVQIYGVDPEHIWPK
jgi:hypothetical protein